MPFRWRPRAPVDFVPTNTPRLVHVVCVHVDYAPPQPSLPFVLVTGNVPCWWPKPILKLSSSRPLLIPPPRCFFFSSLVSFHTQCRSPSVLFNHMEFVFEFSVPFSGKWFVFPPVPRRKHRPFFWHDGRETYHYNFGGTACYRPTLSLFLFLFLDRLFIKAFVPAPF